VEAVSKTDFDNIQTKCSTVSNQNPLTHNSLGPFEKAYKNCPGIDWDVQHFTVPRQVDNPMLIDTLNATYRIKNVSNTPEDFNIDKGGGLASAWSNLDGTFQPNEEYRKVVNVYICRKRQHNHESDDTGNVHHLNNRNDFKNPHS